MSGWGKAAAALVERYAYLAQPAEAPESTASAQRWANKSYPKQVRAQPTGQGELTGEVVVITGEFALDREFIAECLAKIGATVKAAVTGKTTVLVVGGDDPIASPSQKIREAQRRTEDGQAIRILRENQMLKMIRRFI